MKKLTLTIALVAFVGCQEKEPVCNTIVTAKFEKNILVYYPVMPTTPIEETKYYFVFNQKDTVQVPFIKEYHEQKVGECFN